MRTYYYIHDTIERLNDTVMIKLARSRGSGPSPSPAGSMLKARAQILASLSSRKPSLSRGFQAELGPHITSFASCPASVIALSLLLFFPTPNWQHLPHPYSRLDEEVETPEAELKLHPNLPLSTPRYHHYQLTQSTAWRIPTKSDTWS